MPLRRLEPSFRERPWGAVSLEPFFPDARKKAGPFLIGEVWFEPQGMPLLIKFLFTTRSLSVQSHPSDDYARFHHNSLGKTEMWHILKAEPGAKIAAGFKEPATEERVRQAALDGSIMGMLDWYDAGPGDTFLIPAGTVHAIGAGLTLCEIQQKSDVTYRLYDFGSDRELHLERGLAVSRFEPAEARAPLPVRCAYFVTESFDVKSEAKFEPSGQPEVWIALEGQGTVAGESVQAGDVFEMEAGGDPVAVEGTLRLLRTYVPRP